MTMLDERLRRAGEELDRAAVDYSARSSEQAYVAPAPLRPRRRSVAVAVVALLALLVGAVLAVRAARGEDRTVADSPERRVIARNLGGSWLWPDAETDVHAGTPEEITREFAVRVLGLSDFTVVHEAPDPGGMRIDTPTMSLSLLVNQVPGPTERWVVYELRSTELSLNETGLVVTSPPETASLDLFIRDAKGGRDARLDNIPSTVVFPYSDALVSALVIFRNSRGEVIGAASLDAQTVTAKTLITCTFELNDEHATASVHAVIGESASATVGAYTGRVEVVETVGRAATTRSAAYPSLRVDISGPSTPGTTPNEDLPPGVINRSESGLSRAGPSLVGTSGVEGGRLTFSCVAENPGSR